MQTLLNAIQEFEEWSGIPVNTMKTKQMTVDVIETNGEIIEVLTYHDNDLVYDRTLRAKEAIQGHPLDPKQVMTMFSTKSVGNFRYLSAVTPWRQKELERLDRYW